MAAPGQLNETVLPQTVVAPLTRAATFLVVCIRQEQDAYALLRSFCADLSGLIRAVEFRDIEAGLTCVAGFGSDAWDKLFGSPRPAELHPFREIRSGARHAVSTPATSCSTFEPNAWTSVLSWRPGSWIASAMQFRLPTKCTDSGFSTLENMFVGRPPANYDRLLDFSRAVTGSLFFVPTATFLDNVGGDEPNSTETVVSQTSDPPTAWSTDDASLKIGSLKEERDE